MKKVSFILKFIGLFFLYFIITLFTYAVDEVVVTSNLGHNVILTIGSLLSLFVIVILSSKDLKGQLKDFKDNYKNYLGKSILYWIVGFILMAVSNIIIAYFLKEIAPNESANREMLSLYPIYMIVNVSIISPIVEEILFRLSFKNIINKKIPYIIITSLIFGLMHTAVSENLLEIIYFIPYFLLGASFGLSYYDTKNIYSSIFIHILHNTLTLLIIFLNF